MSYGAHKVMYSAALTISHAPLLKHPLSIWEGADYHTHPLEGVLEAAVSFHPAIHQLSSTVVPAEACIIYAAAAGRPQVPDLPEESQLRLENPYPWEIQWPIMNCPIRHLATVNHGIKSYYIRWIHHYCLVYITTVLYRATNDKMVALPKMFDYSELHSSLKYKSALLT